MKQSVHLVFPNLYKLWAFAQAIQVTSMEINTGDKTLSCECYDKDIELAHEKYGARVMQLQDTGN